MNTIPPTPQIPVFLIFPQQKGKGLHFAFILCRLEHLNQKYWAQLCPVLGMGLWEAKRDTSTRSYHPISSLSYKMAKQISFCLCFSLSIPVIKTPHLLSLTQCFLRKHCIALFALNVWDSVGEVQRHLLPADSTNKGKTHMKCPNN